MSLNTQQVFKNGAFFLPEAGTLLPKHGGDATLMLYELRLCIQLVQYWMYFGIKMQGMGNLRNTFFAKFSA
jgi:hypothetical protein